MGPKKGKAPKKKAVRAKSSNRGRQVLFSRTILVVHVDTFTVMMMFVDPCIVILLRTMSWMVIVPLVSFIFCPHHYRHH